MGLVSRLVAYDHSVSTFEPTLDRTSPADVTQDRITPETLTQARELLATPLVALSGQLQALARMAQLQLLSEAGGEPTARSWRATRILGTFLEAWTRSPEIHDSHDFPFLGACTWTPERLRELARRTSEALDEPLPQARAPIEVLDLADLTPLAAGASIATVVDSSPGATSRGQRLTALQPLDRHELRLISEVSVA